jgi:glycosyltransferase involved in cell wall biosynthesis
MLFNVDVVLIFASSGPSVFEKGLMCLLARCARRGVAIRFMSGYLPDECRKSPGYRLWLRLVLRSAHVVGAAGSFWSDYFDRYPEARGKIMEMPNGVVVANGDRNTPTRPSSAHIICVGAITREKGVFDALQVFRAVRRNHPDAVLTIAGGGADFDSFKAAVIDAGLQDCVRVLGWVTRPQIDALLCDADVFLFPSHAECMPNAVLEAMAAGLPVVTTNVGAVSDAIRTGETGFLTHTGDIGAMVDAVEQLLADPKLRVQMGLKARQIVAGRYDIQKVWVAYAKALRQAALAANRFPSVEITESMAPISAPNPK